VSYNVIPTPRFKDQSKRLVRKFPSLKKELTDFEKSLSLNPHQGISLGHDAFKIRLAVRSKGKGKSGGVRVITYLISKQQEIYLLSIYDKSEISTVADKELKRMIDEISKR